MTESRATLQLRGSLYGEFGALVPLNLHFSNSLNKIIINFDIQKAHWIISSNTLDVRKCSSSIFTL